MWVTLLLSTEPNGTFCQADDCQVVMTAVCLACGSRLAPGKHKVCSVEPCASSRRWPPTVNLFLLGQHNSNSNPLLHLDGASQVLLSIYRRDPGAITQACPMSTPTGSVRPGRMQFQGAD